MQFAKNRGITRRSCVKFLVVLNVYLASINVFYTFGTGHEPLQIETTEYIIEENGGKNKSINLNEYMNKVKELNMNNKSATV